MFRQTARTTLDRAVIASVLAMAAMNVFVLSSQLQPAPQVAVVAAQTQEA